MKMNDYQKTAIYAAALEGVISMKSAITPETIADRAITIGDEMIRRLNERNQADPHEPVTD